ncbi:MAG: nitrile hydratase accessory protein [Geminicoccaceae bacterium]
MSRAEPRPFAEPWQVEALALAMALIEAGRLSTGEWAAGLGSAIARAQAAGDPDDGSTYYAHVLDALEELAVAKALTTRHALATRKEAWRAAYATTPHGKPVELTRAARQAAGSGASSSPAPAVAAPSRATAEGRSVAT